MGRGMSAILRSTPTPFGWDFFASDGSLGSQSSERLPPHAPLPLVLLCLGVRLRVAQHSSVWRSRKVSWWSCEQLLLLRRPRLWRREAQCGNCGRRCGTQRQNRRPH